MALTFGQGDTLPNLPFIIKRPNGTPRPLDDVDQIFFIMRNKANSSLILKEPCVLEDQEDPDTQGWGYYDWEPGDLDTDGTMECQFEIHFEDGNIQTVPVGSYIELVIYPQLDS
jgi:hypothetical protein